MIDNILATIQKTFTTFDYFVVICVLFLGVRGWFRGLMKEVFMLGGIVAGVIFGRALGPSIGAALIKSDPSGGAVAGMVGYFVVFTLIMMAATVLAVATRKMIRMTGFGGADHAIGAALGVLLGLVIPGLYLYLVLFVKHSFKDTSLVHSILAPHIMNLMKVLSGFHLKI